MEDLKDFIKICNNMYAKQIKQIIKMIENSNQLSISPKDN